MSDAFANFATSNVALPPSPAASGTSLTVITGEGSRFPATPFNAVVCPGNAAPTPANAEIVRVTNITGDVFTITRTQESTSARTIGVGDRIFQAATAATLNDALSLTPSASSRNVVQPSDPAVSPLTLKEHAGQAAPLLPCEDSDGRAFTAPDYGAVANFVEKMRRQTGDMAMLVLSDSTGTPLGPATNPWPNQLAALLGAAYPEITVKLSLWDGSAYPAATTITTGSGSRTLTIYNMSIAGVSTAYYLGARFAAGVAAINADLVIVSQGHNETTTINDLFRARYIALLEQVRLANPKADTLCIAQNPHTDGSGTMAQWAIEVQRVCGLRGYGFINIHDLFLANLTYDVDWMANSTHPNNTGQTQIAAALIRYLNPPAAVVVHFPRPSPPSTLTEVASNIGLPNPDFSNFDGSTAPTPWTKTASLTLSKDTTHYESPNGYAVKLTAAATEQTLTVPISAKRYAGKWVTFTVRVYKPSGQAAGVGRIAVGDNGSYSIPSIVSLASAPEDGYFCCVVTKFISSDATTVTLYLYATDGTASSGTISVDWVSICEGLLPRATGGPSGPAGAAGPTGTAGRVDMANAARNVLAETVPWGAIRQDAATTAVIPSGELTGVIVGLLAGDVVKGLAFDMAVSGLTISLFKVALYDTSGTQLAVSADQSGTINSTSLKQIAFSSTFTVVTSAAYYLSVIGVYSAGTFSLSRGNATSISAVALDSGKTPLVKQTGQTDAPSPATFAAGNNTQSAFWLAAYK